jgi:hypothetical protein
VIYLWFGRLAQSMRLATTAGFASTEGDRR